LTKIENKKQLCGTVGREILDGRNGSYFGFFFLRLGKGLGCAEVALAGLELSWSGRLGFCGVEEREDKVERVSETDRRQLRSQVGGRV
jgi:hypothetical protein